MRPTDIQTVRTALLGTGPADCQPDPLMAFERIIKRPIRIEQIPNPDTGLMPCPFCGSTDIDPEFWKSDDGKAGPGCMDCGGSNESFEAWNNRV